LGGLSKKAFQIKVLSKENNKGTLLLDSGNLLFKRSRISSGPNQERLTAATIAEIYQDIGYDAVGVGPLDLAAGIKFIQRSNSKGFPWVSANIMDTNGKPVFRQWINKQLGNTKVSISAITAAPANTSEGIDIQPWKRVIPDLLAQIRKENNNTFIILLSTLSNEENRRIGELFPAISLLIGADMQKGNISPRLYNNCLLTQTEKQGKYQGLLEINFGKQRQWGQDSAKQLADLQNRLGSLNWQLRRLEKKAGLAESDAKYNATIIRLNNDKQGLKEQISAIKKTIIREKTEGLSHDLYNYRFIGLGKNMPNDQTTDDTINALNQAIRQLNKKTKARAAKKHRGVTLPPDDNIVGYNVCATCHSPQADFWKSTRHAAAYSTLFKKKKHLDLECLPCHLTLDTRNPALNDFPLESLLSFPVELQSVGCESCHGAGKKHSINPEQFKLVRSPGKKICLTCHTPDHDDNFKYDMKYLHISCPAE
jgi:2',3'-cyclic-nucleotide 2'-phosphodiesterase (5'-nucleotidase family)